MFWNFKNKSGEAAELWIQGDIVDDSCAWIYQWFGEPCTAPNAFREELKKVEGKALTVYIDSYGGDVFAAAGIYDALKKRKGGTKCVVTGKAMSAATVIAMAGDTVEMSPTAIFMIHNPLSEASGYASDLRKVADVLDTVKETIINAYALKSGGSREHISELMDEETYMSAKRAQKEGFVDTITLAPGEAVEIVNFAFPRASILNSCNTAVMKMIEEYAKSTPPADPPTPENSGEEKPDEAETERLRNISNNNKIKFMEVIANARH